MRRRLRKLEIDVGFLRFGELEGEEDEDDEEVEDEVVDGGVDLRMVIMEMVV